MAPVTLVTNVFLSKPEALQALSAALGGEITPRGPGEDVVVLQSGVFVSIDVPKFGEDLPLTLDVSGPDHTNVLSASVTIMSRLEETLQWSISRVGAGK